MLPHFFLYYNNSTLIPAASNIFFILSKSSVRTVASVRFGNCLSSARLAYHRTYGLPVTVSRCSNNYGAYQFPEKLIPLMIYNAEHDKELPVYGEGINVRDWLYVEDHCIAIDMILEKGKVGEVYNVGGHNEKRNIDVVKAILKAAGKPESLIKYVTDRPGHDLRYAIDPKKIGEELGWKPLTPFEKGIEYTIKWYLDNAKWLEDVMSGDYEKYYSEVYNNREEKFGR